MSKSTRLPQIDIIKSVSALAVFFIHYAGIYLQTFDNYNSAYLTPIRNLCFFAVPVFFIVSGFLHAGKEYCYKDIFSKIVYFYILIVTFNFIFAILNNYIRYHNFSISLIDMLRDSFFLKIMPHSHLWFMVPIIILYLFIPVFSSVKPNIIIIFTIITTLFSFFKPFLFPWFNFSFPLPYYFSYFLIGYSIKYLSENKRRVLLIICLILFILCLMIKTLANKFDYNQPLIFFLSLSIFLSLLSININNQHITNIFKQISTASLGIYISHPIFIHYIFTYRKIRFSLPIFWAFFPILFILNTVLVLLAKKCLSLIRSNVPRKI